MSRQTNKQKHINKLVSQSTITLTMNHILNYFFSCVVTTQNCNKLAYHASSCLRWGKQQKKIHGLSYLELAEDLKKMNLFLSEKATLMKSILLFRAISPIYTKYRQRFWKPHCFLLSCLKCCSRA